MEHTQNPQVLYHEILGHSFEKLKKHLPKKHKHIKELIQRSAGSNNYE